MWPSKYAKPVFDRGCAPDPAGGAHDAPHAGPLVGWGGNIPPIPYPTRHRPTFGARHASPRIPARSTPIHKASTWLHGDHSDYIRPYIYL